MPSRSMSEKLEHFFLTLISEKRHRSVDVFLRGCLFFASGFYRRIVELRHFLYDKRIVRNHAIGSLVISIGNLTCGGTGKTPVVEVFARTLREHGRKVAILSRGYKSRDKRSFMEKIKQKFSSKKMVIPPRVVSDGKMVLLDSLRAGDEPYMLASNLPGVVVLVDKDRVKSGQYALEEFACDTLILDDGFQYLKLRPHVNIVLVDSTCPFNNHFMLPRGLMREPIYNIARADYIFLTKSDGKRPLRHLKMFLRKHNKNAEIIECRHRPKYLQNVFQKNEQLPLELLQGKRIAAISGIANPASFEAFLKGFGAKIVMSHHFADHHRFSPQELLDFVNRAQHENVDMILTTEKDAVRIPRVDICHTPFVFLRIEIDILSGEESFQQCISRICFI